MERIKFTKTGRQDDGCPVWNVLVDGAHAGYCWRRKHGSPTFWGAWGFKVNGQREDWSDSRRRSGYAIQGRYDRARVCECMSETDPLNHDGPEIVATHSSTCSDYMDGDL